MHDNRIKQIFFLIASVGLLVTGGCATFFHHTPTLTKWREREYTLCCAYCNAAEWERSVKHHCRGKSKQVGGERYEKVSGYETKRVKEGNRETVETRPQVHREECRSYSCEGEVRPDPLDG